MPASMWTSTTAGARDNAMGAAAAVGAGAVGSPIAMSATYIPKITPRDRARASK